MSTFGWIVLVTAIAGIGGTGLGGVIGAVLRKDSSKVVSLLLSFAAGVMLAVVCFDLLVEAVNPTGGEIQISNLFIAVAVVLVGYGVVYGLNVLIDKRTNHVKKQKGEVDHPETADDLDELIHSDHLAEHRKEKDGLFVAGIIMACAIALHNIPEGMVIGAAYVGADTWVASSGLVLAITIGLHNIPEGMAVSVPLISGGMKPLKAMAVTALSGAPTVIGAMIGYGIGSVGSLGLIISLAFASGAMLYVVFGELLPEAILMWRSKLPAFAILIGLLVGMVLVYV